MLGIGQLERGREVGSGGVLVNPNYFVWHACG
jgi:hypothetical protein